MEPVLELAEAEKLARGGKHLEALAVTTDLTLLYPREIRVWLLLGVIYNLLKDHVAAVASLSEAIQINPNEPQLFFDRGRYYLELNAWSDACEDFSAGLALCDEHNSSYYRQSLYFLRAEAWIRLGKKGEALSDLMQVEDDFKLWTYRLASKSELLAESRVLP